MQVILTQDVSNLASAGEVVEVKDGYGANYLIPKGYAVLATPRNRARLEHEKRTVEARILREKRRAESLAREMEGLSITLTRIVGDEDKIFGSVTAKDVAEALQEEGYDVDRKRVLLDEPLKSLGVYDVQVKLHRDVKTTVKVWVVAD